MKQSVFMTVVIVIALVVSAIIFYGVFGNAANFKTPEKTTPANMMGAIYLGGPIVVFLMALKYNGYHIHDRKTIVAFKSQRKRSD